MKPTYEELETKLLATQTKLIETLSLLKQALERISVLEERLNKNSNNSSKPPSTDSKRNSSNDDKGAKKRRPGVNRKLLSADQIDYFHICTLNCCPCCGSNQIVDQEQSLIYSFHFKSAVWATRKLSRLNDRQRAHIANMSPLTTI